jgi:hypothetical protein
LKVQKESLLEKEDKRCSQEEFRRALSIKGMPRYLEGRELLLKPKIPEIWRWIRGGVLKKKIWDLSLFQSRHEAYEKVWRISRRELASRTVGLPIRRVSSTNWLCEIGGEMSCRGRPVRRLFSIAAWMERLRPSARMMKRKGERGSPYLIPLKGEKGHEGTPLMRREKNAEEVTFIIQVTQL